MPQMTRLIALGLLTVCSATGDAAAAGTLISQSSAERQGLVRAWYVQVPVSAARSRIVHIAQHAGTLLVQTNAAMIHALDAETGRTLWSTPTGKAAYPSLAPAANDEQVAVINGSTLYVLDRKTGNLLWDREISGAPGAGPAMSADRVFVPLLNGQIDGYELDRPNHYPWIYRSFGRMLAQPMTAYGTLGWTTSRGFFYAASTDEVRILYRVETRDEIVSRPAFWTPNFYTASLDGNVYAVHEKTGKQAWKFSVGEPVRQSPAALAGNVYVVPEGGGMYCLDAASGSPNWFTRGMTHFLAASPTRVYAYDIRSRLVVLDGRSGTPLGAIGAQDMAIKVLNAQTDRVYLATDGGIVQCLREAASATPVVYTPPPPPDDAAKSDKAQGAAKAKPEQSADGGEQPKAARGEPAKGAAEAMPDDKPAKPAKKKPAAENDDPFGDK